MKRQRGRGRGGKPGGGGGGHFHHNQPNRTMESSGPEGKVRGPAALIYERYLQAARDATSFGDRVLGENYLQHADHYFRLLRQMQPAVQPQPQQDRFASGEEFEGGDEEGAMEGEGGEESAAEEGDQPEGDFAQQQHQRGHQGGEGERGDRQGGDRDGNRRGRNRRNRFRPDGERGEGEGAQAREESGERREPRPPREPREPREQRNEEGREGFASGPGPRPAFLRQD